MSETEEPSEIEISEQMPEGRDTWSGNVSDIVSRALSETQKVVYAEESTIDQINDAIQQINIAEMAIKNAIQMEKGIAVKANADLYAMVLERKRKLIARFASRLRAEKDPGLQEVISGFLPQTPAQFVERVVRPKGLDLTCDVDAYAQYIVDPTQNKLVQHLKYFLGVDTSMPKPDSNVVVVYGARGSGKSVWLTWIVNNALPIYRAYAKKSKKGSAAPLIYIHIPSELMMQAREVYKTVPAELVSAIFARVRRFVREDVEIPTDPFLSTLKRREARAQQNKVILLIDNIENLIETAEDGRTLRSPFFVPLQMEIGKVAANPDIRDHLLVVFTTSKPMTILEKFPDFHQNVFSRSQRVYIALPTLTDIRTFLLLKFSQIGYPRLNMFVNLKRHVHIADAEGMKKTYGMDEKLLDLILTERPNVNLEQKMIERTKGIHWFWDDVDVMAYILFAIGVTMRDVSAFWEEMNRHALKKSMDYLLKEPMGTEEYQVWIHDMNSYPHRVFLKAADGSIRCEEELHTVNHFIPVGTLKSFTSVPTELKDIGKGDYEFMGTKFHNTMRDEQNLGPARGMKDTDAPVDKTAMEAKKILQEVPIAQSTVTFLILRKTKRLGITGEPETIHGKFKWGTAAKSSTIMPFRISETMFQGETDRRSDEEALEKTFGSLVRVEEKTRSPKVAPAPLAFSDFLDVWNVVTIAAPSEDKRENFKYFEKIGGLPATTAEARKMQEQLSSIITSRITMGTTSEKIVEQEKQRIENLYKIFEKTSAPPPATT